MSHGQVVQCDVHKYDESVARYECVLLFEDGFRYQCLMTRDDILALQHDITSRISVGKSDTLSKFSPQMENSTTDFANRMDYVSRKANVHAPVHATPITSSAASPVKRPSTAQDLYDARETINSGKSVGHQMSLKEYAEANPQRTRLLNGKLFTPELIRKTERGGIPEALQ